jgi:hypothetical protein
MGEGQPSIWDDHLWSAPKHQQSGECWRVVNQAAAGAQKGDRIGGRVEARHLVTCVRDMLRDQIQIKICARRVGHRLRIHKCGAIKK